MVYTTVMIDPETDKHIIPQKIIWVVPGQTSESADMFKPWENMLNPDLFEPFFDVDEILFYVGNQTNTYVSQLSILLYTTTVVNYMCDMFDSNPFHVSAGLSVGEWLALMLLQKISVKDVIEIVTKRAACMRNHCQPDQGGMYAIIGLESFAVSQYIKSSNIENVYLTGTHTNTHLVVSGLYESLDLFIAYLKKQGCKFKHINLNAMGPFHTPLMKKSADLFSKTQTTINVTENDRTFIDGLNGNSMNKAVDICRYMQYQIVNPNSWKSVVNRYQSLGITHQIEISPKPVLTKLTRRMSPLVNCYCVQSPECVKKIVKRTQGKYHVV